MTSPTTPATADPAIPTGAATDAPEPTATLQVTAATPNPGQASVRFQEVGAGFIEPTLLTHAGDGTGTIYVSEKRGRIYTLDGELFLDLTDRVIDTGLSGNARELGFLGLAFHPEFESNNLFYVHYNDLDGDSVISEFQTNPNGTGNPQSERVLLAFDQPEDHFNGGTILFGPDGYLYIAIGTGGGRPQDFANSQDLGSLYGKILRIDVDSGDPYAIPPDNPYINAPDARPEVWAYGLRNPWRFAFDAATGDIFIAEPGQFSYEWVHHQSSGPDGAPPGGVNFGWPIYEGFHCFDIPSGMVDENGDCALPPDYKAPIFEYPRGQDGGCVIIGGSVYRGPAIPALQGAYLYSDFCSGVVSAAWLDGDNGWQTLPLADLPGLVSSFGEDGSGELYVMNISEGLIYKMVPA
ncbi:MAG: PQQ-dependent sugar dehydrogenase [Thermomicrobiales bacterium]